MESGSSKIFAFVITLFCNEQKCNKKISSFQPDASLQVTSPDEVNANEIPGVAILPPDGELPLGRLQSRLHYYYRIAHRGRALLCSPKPNS